MPGRLLTALAAWLILAPVAAAQTPVTSVINGPPATPGQFPFMAFVHFQNSTEGFDCSGTLVSSTVVLTAAHCVENEGILRAPSNIQVITGTTNWTVEPRTVSGILGYSIDGYNPATNYYDAAVLHLAAPVSSPPVRLATSAPVVGARGFTVGWGKQTPSQTGPSAELGYGETAVQEPTVCSAHSLFSSNLELCTLDTPTYGTASCSGDSGGPFLVSTGIEWIETGIVSHGPEGCPTSEPRVLTRADVVSSWVAKKVLEWAPVPSTSPSAPVAAPPSAPAPTVAVPPMTLKTAKVFAAFALSKRLGYRFNRRQGYRIACHAESGKAQECVVRWTALAFGYSGSVHVSYVLDGDEAVPMEHYRIKRIPSRCRIACRPFLFSGTIVGVT